MQELTPVLRLEDRTNRDDPDDWENLSITIPDPALTPRLASSQYAPEDDPEGFANILDDTFITENNISRVKPNDRGERVMFIHDQKVLQLQTLATGRNVLTFKTSNEQWLKDSIIALMQSRISVKKSIGEYVLLMGNKILTIYQDITFTEDTFLAEASLTAFQPINTGVNPRSQVRPRKQSPEGERIIIHHTAEVHTEPRQPTLYPPLPATYDSQPPEEEQREPAATVQQEIPAEAYGQQPSINPDFRRQAYIRLG